ncbi:GtrA family protein [Pseudomonas nicosulfuronedens]
MKNSLLRQYLRFLLVGGGLAALCVVLREVFGQLFPLGRYVYAVSVFLAYALCMVLNYLISGRFVYRLGRRSWGEALRFLLVAVVTSLLVSLLADQLFRFLQWLGGGRYIGAISLMIAALLLSLLSFSLNRKWVYRNGRRL